MDVRATRAAFAAGTLGTVGDDSAREDAERDAVPRDADRHYAYAMQHPSTPASQLRPIVEAYVDEVAEIARQERLKRWQAGGR